MTTHFNALHQPIGAPLPDWTARVRPEAVTLTGNHCRLEPLDVQRHGADLLAAHRLDPEGRNWTYLFSGPFTSDADFLHALEKQAAASDVQHYAVIELATQQAVGTLALLRMEPAHGVVEVGHITFSPRLQRTPISTEAQYLLMAYVFDQLGYRRYEWKCDSLNAPSRQAAQRLGFVFEGIFRQAVVYKGRNRDTAWFSITDSEWPALRAAFVAWLDPDNFDAQGQQRASLADLRQRKPAPTAAA